MAAILDARPQVNNFERRKDNAMYFRTKTDSNVLLDVKGGAEKFWLSGRSVYRMADVGRMPHGFKIGRRRRWGLADIETWINKGFKPVRKGGKR